MDSSLRLGFLATFWEIAVILASAHSAFILYRLKRTCTCLGQDVEFDCVDIFISTELQK